MTRCYSWLHFITMVCWLAVVSSENVCTKFESVPHTRNVLKRVPVTKTRRSFWGRVIYELRYDYSLQPETTYNMEIRKFCCPGYTGPTDNCVPICDNECPENAYCRAPNECHCKDGFEETNDDSCKPTCSSCGIHSYCSHSGQCLCDEGYKLDSNAECVPSCTVDCGAHSNCSAPETCSCETGYEKTADDSCQAKCTPSCGTNSYCKAPDQCQCFEGYGINEEAGVCTALCEPACGANSRCIKPGQCQCNEGYANTSDATLGCQPDCGEGCPENSRCMQPGKCLCNEGYTYNAASRLGISHYCEPHCEQKCSTYGKCVAPNVCECYAGYEAKPNQTEHICEPQCNGCQNGSCLAPGLCVCQVGYLMGPHNHCVAQCTLGCVHGECTEPEICSCEPGYRFAKNSVHVCEPICEPSCENADCIAHNMCICHLGFEPRSSTDNTTAHICHASATTMRSMTNRIRRETTAVDAATTAELSCFGKCQCWRKLDSPKCENICRDEFDQPCLDLTHCSCDQHGQQLVCKSLEKAPNTPTLPVYTTVSYTTAAANESEDLDDSDSMEDESLEYTETRFECQISAPMIQATTARSNEEAALNSTRSAAKWPAIFGWILATCVLLTALALAGYRYVKLKQSRQLAMRQASGLINNSFEEEL